jgi:hypothetical protein
MEERRLRHRRAKMTRYFLTKKQKVSDEINFKFVRNMCRVCCRWVSVIKSFGHMAIERIKCRLHLISR